MYKGPESLEETLQGLTLAGRHCASQAWMIKGSEGLVLFREHNYIKNTARHEL